MWLKPQTDKKAVIASIAVVLALTGAMLMGEKGALAKAAFQSKNQMIDCCEVIAVVDIKKVEKVEEKGLAHTYSQKATAIPVYVIKGQLPRSCTIYGGEDFRCAQCNYQPGKALVFLNHDRNLLIGCNWHFSVRPIRGNRLDWYDDEGRTLKPASLRTVTDQIEAQLGNDRKLAKLTGALRELSQVKVLCDRVAGDTTRTSQTSKIWADYKSARASLKPEQKDLLWSMYRNSTPAGRIYAAMLLHHVDKEEGKKALAMLSGCNATIDYVSGCEVSNVGVWQIASDLFTQSKYLSLSLNDD